MAGSRPGIYAIDLDRKALIYEVYRLEREIEIQAALMDAIRIEKEGLLSEVKAYRKKFEEIIDSRLGLGQPLQTAGVIREPIGRRRNWSEIQSRYEAKKREELWRERIAAVEASDADRTDASVLPVQAPAGGVTGGK